MPGSIAALLVKSGPVQCLRCQGFWHSAQKCPNPVACVCCGRRHHVTECPVRSEPPTCVNCGGQHWANHKACPALRKEVHRALRPPPAEFVHVTMVEGGGAGAGLMAAALDPDHPPKPRRRRRGGRKHKRTKETDTTSD